MTDINMTLIQNAHKSFEMLHRSLFLWGSAMLGLIFLPVEVGHSTIKLPIVDISVSYFAAILILVSIVYVSSIVALSTITKVQLIKQKLAKNDLDILFTITSYPSLATVEQRYFRITTIGMLVFAQFSLGAAPFLTLGVSNYFMATISGLIFALPMFVLMFKMYSWDK